MIEYAPAGVVRAVVTLDEMMYGLREDWLVKEFSADLERDFSTQIGLESFPLRDGFSPDHRQKGLAQVHGDHQTPGIEIHILATEPCEKRGLEAR